MNSVVKENMSLLLRDELYEDFRGYVATGDDKLDEYVVELLRMYLQGSSYCPSKED